MTTDQVATQRWIRLAFWLVFLTLLYNIVEAVIALWAGITVASISLFGFGLDSIIESAAAGVLFWHLAQEKKGIDPKTLEKNEKAVHRFVGGTFIALAVYILFQSSFNLWARNQPEESLVGIALACFSLVIMPLVAWKKIEAADKIGSAALRAEAKETFACALLSLILLVGLLANYWKGWWWTDPVAALLMLPWLIKEGKEGLRGGCGCH